MRVNVSREIIHLCPYKDEVDVGALDASWDGDEVELYAFAQYLDKWAKETVTHERMTEAVAEYLNDAGGFDVRVATSWNTATMTVTVTA